FTSAIVHYNLYLHDALPIYVQSIDYRYNIRGWLTSINNAELTNTPLTNDDTDDLFGMELLYNNEDPALGNSVQFNGNISAVKWRSEEHTSELQSRENLVCRL